MDGVVVVSGAVFKVMIAVAIGGSFCALLPGGEQSSKDLNFVNTVIFLPAFAFSALAENLSWALLSSIILVIGISVVSFLVSLVFGVLCSRYCCSNQWMHERTTKKDDDDGGDTTAATKNRGGIVAFLCEAWNAPSPADYRPLYQLNLTLQNAGTFPLALLQALASGGGTSWFGETQNNEATNVIFVYQSMVALYYWTVGLWLVKRGKRQRTAAMKAHVAAAAADRLRQDALVLGEEDSFHSESREDLSGAVSQSEHLGDVSDDFFRQTIDILRHGENNFALQEFSLDRQKPDVTAQEPQQQQQQQAKAGWTRESILQFLLGLNLPLTGSLAGIVVALVPGMHWLFYNTPLALITGSISMIGKGGVPVSLLVLGSNLTASGLKPLLTMDARFLVVGNLLVTFVIPGVKVSLFFMLDSMGLFGTLAVHVKFAFFVELVAPTAIVASVICRLQDYMAETTSGFLMIQYVVAVISSSAWLWVFLMWYEI